MEIQILYYELFWNDPREEKLFIIFSYWFSWPIRISSTGVARNVVALSPNWSTSNVNNSISKNDKQIFFADIVSEKRGEYWITCSRYYEIHRIVK